MSGRREGKLDTQPDTGTSNNSIPTHTHTSINSIKTMHTAIGVGGSCMTCARKSFGEDILDEYFIGPEKTLPEMPKPELHKVTMSFRSEDGQKLYAAFAEQFGRPMRFPRFYCFENGLRLSKYNKFYWWTVSFNATEEILDGLLGIVHKGDSPVQVVHLQSIEVAWNFPCPDHTREELEALQLVLVKNMLPSFSNARLWLAWGQRQFINFGEENGRVTAYFQKRRRDNMPVKRPDWKPKVYVKTTKGVRHLHIEVTMEKRFLLDKNAPMMSIPETVSPEWLARFPLSKFLNFASFCEEKFRSAMQGTEALKEWNQKQSATKRRYKRLHFCQVLLSTMQHRPACEQKSTAHKIAEMLGARRLKGNINKGEFDCPYNPFKE